MRDTPTRELAVFRIAFSIKSDELREEYLQQACGSDRWLYNRVAELLQANKESPDFLETPPTGVGRTPDLPPITEGPGTMVGRYKLLEEIGEGGMGLVFLARQQEPVKRDVALKIIKPGMDTKEVVARFETERQALALMDHPNIARVIDAGSTDSGRPFFVMELVQGTPLTDYCDQSHLSTSERLELFVQICHAVQHAHQRGIIHRDLKPSNVLVSRSDDGPVPKIIDFGIAKATKQPITEKGLLTSYGQMLGTPLYMSPEQAGMDGLDVDTRSDIYLLGVMLYELLTGSTPFDQERARQADYDEIRRMIREDEPPRPSTRISTLGAGGKKDSPLAQKETAPFSPAMVAANRKTDPAKLSRLLRRELDWIVIKALQKDRARRYQTAGGFARDIERYLADEPIEARPPTLLDRVGRWARRHKAVVAAMVVLLVTATIGFAASTYFIAREKAATDDALQHWRETAARERELKREADRLHRQAQRNLEQAHKNLQNSLDAANQLVERVVNDKLFGKPEMQELRQTFMKDALQLYQVFISEHGTDPAVRYQTAVAYARIGHIQLGLGRHVQGEQAYRKGIQASERLVGEFPSEQKYREMLAWTYLRLGMLIAIYDLRAQDGGAEVRRASRLYDELARDCPDVPRYRQYLAWSYHTLCDVLFAESNYEEEERVSRKALVLRQKLVSQFPLVPLYHVEEGIAWCRLGHVLVRMHRPQQALQAYREDVRIHEKIKAEFPDYEPEGAGVAQSYHRMGGILESEGKLQQAEQLYRKAVVTFEKAIAKTPLESWRYMFLAYVRHDLAELLERTRRFDEAIQEYQRTVEVYEKQCSLAPGEATHRRKLALSYYFLALACVDAGDIKGYRSACARLHDRFGDSKAPEEVHWLAWTCAVVPEAVPDFSKAVAAAELALKGDPKSALYLNTLGAILYRASRYEEALHRLTEADKLIEKPDTGGRSSPAYTWFFLAMAHYRLGNREEAKQWFDEAVAWTDKAMQQDEVDRSLTRDCRLALRLLRAEAETLLLESAAGQERATFPRRSQDF
jgi:serine/threonine protein kinase/Tfp pilus assembly protein PilF